jgi:hypothetical protein
MKPFWTSERKVELDRYLKAGKSTMEIALAMGLKRKQITNICVRSGLVSMCVDCGVKPKYRQYRRCMSCKEAREVALAPCASLILMRRRWQRLIGDFLRHLRRRGGRLMMLKSD